MDIYRVKCGNGNCYVLEEKGRAVLVDTGTIEYRKAIEEKIKRFPIKLIVLTHGHFDHCQNADYFSKLFGAPVAMNKKDVGLLKNQMKEKLSAKTIPGKIVLLFSLLSLKKVKMNITPSVFLEDGDLLKAYGVDAEVIALPGHTQGSIGIDCKEDCVIVGDALMNMFYPTVSMLYGNEKMMRQSAEKIKEMGDKTIYFGHGKPVKTYLINLK